MSNVKSGFRVWILLSILGLILYMLYAFFFIYLQYLYFENSQIINSMFYGIPYSSILYQPFSAGYVGILGVVDLLLTLVMIYIITFPITNPQSIGTTRIAMIILVVIQLFLGNLGFLLGPILMVISVILMR